MTEQHKELLEAAKEVLLKMGTIGGQWDRLRKAIDGVEKESYGWQPIETAPKDGTRILLGRTGYDWTFVCSWCEQSKQWKSGTGAMEMFVSTTHWMPLPAAPAKGDGK